MPPGPDGEALVNGRRDGAGAGGRLSGTAFAGVDPRLEELVERLGSEAGAYAYLEELRWPDGVCCARCLSFRVAFLETRSKHQCRDCGYQFRVTAGTALHDSHVSASKWLLAVRLMLEAEEGFPANRLFASIGGSYKTSWFVEHRVRAAMAQALLEVPEQRSTTDDPPGPAERTAGSAYGRPSADHLHAYWAESRWRANHRNSHDAYRATVRALLTARPVTYRQLTSRPRCPTTVPAG